MHDCRVNLSLDIKLLFFYENVLFFLNSILSDGYKQNNKSV